MLREHLRRDRAGAGAEAAVGLLQRDDVGVELAENSEPPRRIAAAVEPDALAHIIGGDLYHGGRLIILIRPANRTSGRAVGSALYTSHSAIRPSHSARALSRTRILPRNPRPPPP